jgi:hypothetical protein
MERPDTRRILCESLTPSQRGGFNLGSSLATNLGNIQAALFFVWEYLIYYRNNNNNKAETAVIKVVDMVYLL